jgi:hypothetical protein
MFVELPHSRHGRRQQGAYAPQFTRALWTDIGSFPEPGGRARGRPVPLFPSSASPVPRGESVTLSSSAVLRDQLPDCRLHLPISARSIVSARRVTQDHMRPFCTVKAGTAGVVVRTRPPHFGSPPRRLQELSPVKTARTKRKIRACPSDVNRFGQRTTSIRD